MKKSLILTLVLALSLSLFAGCGDKDKKEGKKDPEVSATVAATDEATETPEATEEPTETATLEATEEPEETETPDATEEPEETEEPVADVDAVFFRFYDEEDYMWISDSFDPAGCQRCTAEYFDGGLLINILQDDPFLTIPADGETGEYFSLAEYPVMKISLKNGTPATTFEAFFAPQLGDRGEDCFQATIEANDEDWQQYIFNIAELKGQAFVDARTEMNHVRMDCVSLGEHAADIANYTFEVEYFAFFKTVEDAEAWNP